MREIENLKEAILKDEKEYPRMDLDTKFKFRCHPGVPCFNECCADVNIFLTPYDVIRLKNALGISSQEFLSKYTIAPFDKTLKDPMILRAMQENEKKSCHFVGDSGCTVYADRPWACRMYPLGLASPREGMTGPLQKEFYFLLQEPVCKGFNEDNEQTVAQWLDSEGIDDYNEMGELFKNLTLHSFFDKGGKLDPGRMEMFFTVCYNIDKFREFVFESSFLQKFDVDDALIEKIKTDDVELFKFGCQWLRFAAFGEDTMKVDSTVANTKLAELKAKQKLK